jgi:NAD(P)H:quinone oxidoreductase type IV
MSKVLVLYYSAYRHIEALANAVAEGARETGAKVDVKRVPETVPAEIAKAHHFKLDQAAPIATIDDLANYDAIVIGTGTRFGRISSQMATFQGDDQRSDALQAIEKCRRLYRIDNPCKRLGWKSVLTGAPPRFLYCSDISFK